MDGYTVEESRRIRSSAERTPGVVECPRCSPRLGRSTLMRPTEVTDAIRWHCSHCGQDLTIARRS